MLCVDLTFFMSKIQLLFIILMFVVPYLFMKTKLEEVLQNDDFLCCRRCTLDWLTITLCRTLFFIVRWKISSVIKYLECETES